MAPYSQQCQHGGWWCPGAYLGCTNVKRVYGIEGNSQCLPQATDSPLYNHNDRKTAGRQGYVRRQLNSQSVLRLNRCFGASILLVKRYLFDGPCHYPQIVTAWFWSQVECCARDRRCFLQETTGIPTGHVSTLLITDPEGGYMSYLKTIATANRMLGMCTSLSGSYLQHGCEGITNQCDHMLQTHTFHMPRVNAGDRKSIFSNDIHNPI